MGLAVDSKVFINLQCVTAARKRAVQFQAACRKTSYVGGGK